MAMKQEWEQVKSLIADSERIVFFGGAGVSTESGVPDFRGKDGFYKQQRAIPLEVVLSHDYFVQHPEGFYDWMRKGNLTGAKPNQAHYYLAHLEQEGKLSAIVTQNADGLHQAAGSKNVFELHGNSSRFYCMNCGQAYSLEYVEATPEVPYCETCHGLVRPDVVLYGEALNEEVLYGAMKAISEADMLIVGGTSLLVQPAASLIDLYQGNRLVLINEEMTPADSRANVLIRDKIAQVFSHMN